MNSEILLIKDNRLNEFFTIWSQDKILYLSLIDDFFEESERFNIIYDKDELSNILKNKFLSKDRGEKYDETMTSVTVITSSLYPKSLISDKGLLLYKVKLTKEKKQEQEEKNKESLNKGNDLHKALELIAIDKIKKYERTNFDSYFDSIENKDICKKALLEFKQYKDKTKTYYQNEMLNTEFLFPELFIKDSILNVQGTVDSICIKNDLLTLLDYKTTSNINKKNNSPTFKTPSEVKGYQRQLCLYFMMIRNQKLFSKKELDKLAYELNIFHWIKEEYRKYIFESNDIKSHTDNILTIIDWFNSNIK